MMEKPTTRCGAAQASCYRRAHMDPVFCHVCERPVNEAPQVGSRDVGIHDIHHVRQP